MEARKDWMSINELAQYFKFSRRTMYRLTEQRGFPKPLRSGRLVRYDREAVETFLTAER